MYQMGWGGWSQPPKTYLGFGVSSKLEVKQNTENVMSCHLHDTLKNSIAFGSAPRREADSQPISQSVRQAVSQTVSQASRQADRNTQFGFISGSLGYKR